MLMMPPFYAAADATLIHYAAISLAFRMIAAPPPLSDAYAADATPMPLIRRFSC